VNKTDFFPGLVGQARAKEILNRGIESGKLAQTLIFVGRRGVGKKMAALLLANALHSRGNASAIGNANQAGKADTFVFSEILAEMREQKKENPFMEAARSIIKFLEMSPLSSEMKVAIIDNADMLTAGSQNSLLKTLEEPRLNAVLILVTEDEDRLLPTIVSRSRIINFAPLTNDEIKKVVPDVSPEILELADGSIGFAKQMAESIDARLELNQIRDFWLSIKDADIETKISWANDKRDRQDAIKFLEIGLVAIRNQWLANPTIIGARVIWLIQRTIYQIRENVNARAALEAMLLAPVFN